MKILYVKPLGDYFMICKVNGDLIDNIGFRTPEICQRVMDDWGAEVEIRTWEPETAAFTEPCSPATNLRPSEVAERIKALEEYLEELDKWRKTFDTAYFTRFKSNEERIGFLEYKIAEILDNLKT